MAWPAHVAAQPAVRGNPAATAVDGGAPSTAAQPASPPQTPRCALRARPLAPDVHGAVPDPRTAPAAVATDGGGVLVAWRAVDGVLRVARLGATFDRVAPDRELARPVSAFAAVAAPGGAAVALVERSAARGVDAVLLARLTSAGEARNVPRELGHADAVDGVSVVSTSAGYAVAWGARDGAANSGTYVVLTDARGVPRTPARRLLDATTPRLAYLPAADLVVVSATSAAGEPTVAALDGSGAINGTARWPAGARTLLAAPSGASVLGLTITGGEVFGASAPATAVLPRWTNDGARIDTPIALRLAPGATVAGAVADRGGLVAALDEPGTQRELIARVGIDGAATLLAVRPGWLGAIVPAGDNATGYTVIGHEPPPAGQGRLAIVQLACPRSVVVPAATTTASTAGPSGATATSVTASSDAGMTDAARAVRNERESSSDASGP